MTLIINNLKELNSHTLGYLETALRAWPDVNNQNRIKMIENEIERYYARRALITGRLGGVKGRIIRDRAYRVKRLLKENYRLRKQLAEKNHSWWKFWRK